MKLTAPHYAIGPLMHTLHDSEVGAVLMERTGPGWVIEFMTPLQPETVTAITRLGAVIVGVERT
jgi:hypothetical protein